MWDPQRLEWWWGARFSGRGGSHEGAQEEQPGDQPDPRGAWNPEAGERGPRNRMSSPIAPAPGGQRRPGLSSGSASADTEDQEEPGRAPRPDQRGGMHGSEERGSVLAGGLQSAECDGGGTQRVGGLPVPCFHLVGEAESVEDRAWPCGEGLLPGLVLGVPAATPAHRVPGRKRELPLRAAVQPAGDLAQVE